MYNKLYRINKIYSLQNQCDFGFPVMTIGKAGTNMLVYDIWYIWPYIEKMFIQYTRIYTMYYLTNNKFKEHEDIFEGGNFLHQATFKCEFPGH